MPLWFFPEPTTVPATPAQEGDTSTTGLDHVEGALDRLCEQFRRKPNIVNLLTALVGPHQSIEDALQQLIIGRTLDNATGQTLTFLGEVVGQARNGLDDDTLRRYIRARILTNRSSGVINQLLKITKLIVYDDDCLVTIENENYATMTVTLSGVDMTDELANVVLDFLNTARSGATRILLEWTNDESNTLTFTPTSSEFDDSAHSWCGIVTFAGTGDFQVLDDADVSVVTIPAGTYTPDELVAVITACFVADGVDDTWTFTVEDGYATFRSTSNLDLSIIFDEVATRNTLGFTADVTVGPGEDVVAPNRCVTDGGMFAAAAD